jgi:hypothetical protein
MPTIHRVRNLKVVMFLNDHDPPHFHVHGPGWRLRAHVGSWETQVVSGRPRDYADVLAWARGSEAELLRTWRELRERA